MSTRTYGSIRAWSGPIFKLLGTLALVFNQIGCTPQKGAGLQIDSGQSRSSGLTVSVAGGNGQTAIVSSDFTGYLVAFVRNAQGEPVTGVDVSWSVVSGSATIIRSSASTINVDGSSAVNVSAGSVSGPIVVRASISGGSSATFNLTSVSDTPSTIEIASGNGQTGVVGRALSAPLTVLVKDQYGNAVPNKTIDWTVTAQGGSVNPTTANTSSSGTASTSLTLGTVTGTAAVKAAIRGYGLSVTFNATAVADVPASIAISSGNNQAGTRGTALADPLVVVVRDAYSNLVPSAQVDWAITAGGGSFTPTSSNTSAGGLASSTWTLGNRGTNTATATVNGTALSVTFNATADPAPFTQTWTFDQAGASTTYTYDSSKVDFAGGSALLKSQDQTDDDSTALGFAGGIFSGVIWDSVANQLKLGNFGGCDGSTTNCSGVAGSALSGTFTSRVMDAGTAVAWQSLLWQTAYPYGKELPGSTNSPTATEYPSVTGGLMTGNIGLWHLNEAAADTVSGGLYDAADSSGTGNHASENAALAYNQAGRLNSALHFDGTGRLTFLNNSIPTGAAARTVSLWFKKDSTGDQALFAYGMTSGTDRVFEIAILSGSLVFTSNDNTTSATSIPVSSGVWHLAAVSYDGTSVRIYLDGVLRHTQAFVLNTSSNGRRIGGGIINSNFIGSIDEVALWSRQLSDNEIAEVYRRGNSNLRFQVRSCAVADCSDGTFVGSAGTGTSYFSELNNSAITRPSLTFSNFGLTLPTRQYFQYRVIFDSLQNNAPLGPTLKNVTVGPAHYNGTVPTVINVTTVDYITLTGFTETLGAAGCAGGIRYALSRDNVNWYWWNGSAWAASNSTYAQATSAASINSNIGSFPSDIGLGNLYWKLFLKSDGSQACEITELSVTGTN